MKVVIFCHSLASDWNHGNAHFLRGITRELQQRGHGVRVLEPENGWSRENLLRDHGNTPLKQFKQAYPDLRSETYSLETLSLDRVLADADLVLVHEWNEHELVRRIGLHRARHSHYKLLFHDTHHRAVTQPETMAAYDLRHYDGVLAFGEVLREVYLENGWTDRAWTWHEAADTTTFRPLCLPTTGHVVWIGNWGDEERTHELQQYFFDPVRELNLKSTVYGVRYPEHAKEMLRQANINYCGWLPNFRAREVFARYLMTVHVPRRPYVEKLPGIPTIRVFEALACGIPLVSAYWEDAEHLFKPGQDFLMARSCKQMTEHFRMLLHDRDVAASLAESGLRRILERHTCAHRVDELLDIAQELGIEKEAVEEAA